jgi:hypothetical protein
VTKRINAESAVLKNYDTQHARDQESSECRMPTAPRKTDKCRERERDEQPDYVDITMLPGKERVFFQIGDVFKRCLRPQLEHKPADVCVKQTLGNAVGIFIMIDVLMVVPMFGSPPQDGTLKCAGSKNHGEQANEPVSPESQMRKKSMVA